MNITFEVLPNYRLAYIRKVGPYGPSNIQTMNKLKKWAQEKNLLHDSAILLGIPQDNPKTTPPKSCRYDAGIVISEDYQLDDSICEAKLTGGNYMICKIKHTAEDIQKAWDEIISYIINTGYPMDNKPILERYIIEMVNNHYCELCIPVKL